MATKTDLNEFKSAFNEFRSEVRVQFSEIQERYEFLIEQAATKQDLHEVEQNLMKALNIKTSNISDRFDAKIAELKHDIIQAVRGANKKFIGFAI